MLSPDPGVPLDDELLSLLPRAPMDLLTPYMTTKQLSQGQVLLGAGEEFGSRALTAQTDAFPSSRPAPTERSGEFATVGREGVVGAMAGFGTYRSSVRSLCNCRSPGPG